MFRFDFESLDGDETTLPLQPQATPALQDVHERNTSPEHAFAAFSWENLDFLPDKISYSFVKHGTMVILKRDLFDVRFQLAAQDEVDNDNKASALDGESDLIKTQYEGGLKTWECATDLAWYLHRSNWKQLSPYKLLELGCGTALPSCYLFGEAIKQRHASQSDNHGPVEIYLQDYNRHVLELVTIPNLILAYHAATTTEDAPLEGDLELTDELVASFRDCLSQNNIHLYLFHGDWSTCQLDTHLPRHSFDLVLTSETIYDQSSLPSLCRLLMETAKNDADSLCLVACKRLYFGLSGGEGEFRQQISALGGELDEASASLDPNEHQESLGTVERAIFRVLFPGHGVPI